MVIITPDQLRIAPSRPGNYESVSREQIKFPDLTQYELLASVPLVDGTSLSIKNLQDPANYVNISAVKLGGRESRIFVNFDPKKYDGSSWQIIRNRSAYLRPRETEPETYWRISENNWSRTRHINTSINDKAVKELLQKIFELNGHP